MALKMILNKQTDFTGEFPAEYAASGLWRFNESAPDEDTALALFAYVQGLTTLATMENVHYAYKWEDKLTDLIGIFSCEF